MQLRGGYLNTPPSPDVTSASSRMNLDVIPLAPVRRIFALWARLRLRPAAEERLQNCPGDETLVIVRTTDHLNSDGVVNVLDLIILLLNFG